MSWAVAIHAAAGTLLAEGGPGYGYLGRELVTAIPNAIAALCPRDREPSP